jgi:hypothetical protein
MKKTPLEQAREKHMKAIREKVRLDFSKFNIERDLNYYARERPDDKDIIDVMVDRFNSVVDSLEESMIDQALAHEEVWVELHAESSKDSAKLLYQVEMMNINMQTVIELLMSINNK